VEALSISDALHQAMWVTLFASLPLLLVAMVVGLIIGILQTATSIQEQTLVFIPKIVAVILAMILLGPWMCRLVGDYATFLFESLHRFVS